MHGGVTFAKNRAYIRVTNRLGGNHNSTTITGFYGAKQEIAHKQAFELHADEPPILAGNDEEPILLNICSMRWLPV